MEAKPCLAFFVMAVVCILDLAATTETWPSISSLEAPHGLEWENKMANSEVSGPERRLRRSPSSSGSGSGKSGSSGSSGDGTGSSGEASDEGGSASGSDSGSGNKSEFLSATGSAPAPGFEPSSESETGVSGSGSGIGGPIKASKGDKSVGGETGTNGGAIKKEISVADVPINNLMPQAVAGDDKALSTGSASPAILFASIHFVVGLAALLLFRQRA